MHRLVCGRTCARLSSRSLVRTRISEYIGAPRQHRPLRVRREPLENHSPGVPCRCLQRCHACRETYRRGGRDCHCHSHPQGRSCSHHAHQHRCSCRCRTPPTLRCCAQVCCCAHVRTYAVKQTQPPLALSLSSVAMIAVLTPAHCMHTACILHAHCMHTACTLHAHCMHTACTLQHAHRMHAARTLHASCMYTARTRHAHCTHAACTLHARCTHTVRTLHTH